VNLADSEQRWVIVYEQGKKWRGLYTGQWLTRANAIADHTAEKGKTWRECRRDGDRAVKATIMWMRQ
jgi:hypothetical protein